SPTNFILYSGVDERPLRFAPVTKSKQFEALALRNELVTIEQGLVQLARDPQKAQELFDQLQLSRLPRVKGFVRRDVEYFEKVYQGMSELEHRYFLAYSAFIAREHQLAKTGIQGVDQVNGLASLWLNDFTEKTNGFELISHLLIDQLATKADDPIIHFTKTERTSDLANFRKGDIAVLYPHDDPKANVLSNQIFKCTIIEITPDQVIVRLRSRQFNDRIFHQYQFWNLEHDLLDSSFTAMYRSLFEFVQHPPDKKALLLTQQSPRQPENIDAFYCPGLTDEQQSVFAKAIAAPDYFLLWGPPGTGKTSVMLKQLVSHIINKTDENILLLAYTNRAVDEICESIERIDDFMKREYIRIGSKYATAERFQAQLLNNKISHIKNRQALRQVIDEHRIFVSTVASIAGKKELLQLKKFHRVIIDEASQILEPMLVGLLPHFDRFILIGDHKQLPAVVVQSEEESATSTPSLQDIGLQNLRVSLFERLFKRCQVAGWDWAYDRLSHQGRMHQSIMDFPNRHFYQGFLKILPEELMASQLQIRPLQYALPPDANELEEQLCQQRMLFLPTRIDLDSDTFKTNQYEAQLVSQLIGSLQRIYDTNGLEWKANTLGVITPYRAQIAQIRQVLQQENRSIDGLTIDTVERYQGGARDVIVISLCVNQISQLASLVSTSDEGVDRKLNVALTRARQQLIILGHPGILRDNVIYQALMDYCQPNATNEGKKMGQW
ncbi:MAG: AAA domain-containing protein, partial [Bacteroidota bacterium]